MNLIVNTDELVKQVKQTIINDFSEKIEIEVFPAVLNKSQLKKFLNLERSTVDYIITMKGFPKINLGKGKQERFVKSLVVKWLEENYTKLNNIY